MPLHALGQGPGGYVLSSGVRFNCRLRIYPGGASVKPAKRGVPLPIGDGRSFNLGDSVRWVILLSATVAAQSVLAPGLCPVSAAATGI